MASSLNPYAFESESHHPTPFTDMSTHYAPTPVPPGSLPGKQTISIDMNAFIITRDALCSSFITLSNSLDKAVKAYLDHTNAVIAGDSTLNVTYLTQPFQSLSDNVQHLAQQAMQHGQQLHMHNAPTTAGAEETAAGEVDGKGKRKKRAYKKRDPGAPKRPLTAYFRYLGEMRPSIGKELADAAAAKGESQKPGDLSKTATTRWNALPEDGKQPYRDAYNHALKDYTEECRKFQAAGGKLDPSDEKRIAAADKGLALEESMAHANEIEGEEEDADAEEIEEPVDAKISNLDGAADEEEDESSSSDESTDDEDEEETAPTPAPAPPPAAKATPKSSMKKGKQAAAPTPQFNSINPGLAAPAPATTSASSASPDRKRKAPTASVEPAADAPAGKKRGRKSNAEKAAAAAAAESAPAAAPVAQMQAAAEEPAKKRRKKKGVEA